MEISFKGKIPISTVNVYDKKGKNFKEATLYELDGKDESDLDELAKDNGEWFYKYNILVGLTDKQAKMAREGFSQKPMPCEYKFYILENQDGSTGGLCETMTFGHYTDIVYLESNPNKKYGLTGQTMLASIAKQMLKNPNATMIIDDPAVRARDFYTKDCGFKETSKGSHDLIMKEDELQEFVENVEEKTHSPIVDIIS